MGADQVIIKNIKVAKVMPGENLLLVAGAVPGPKKSVVLVVAKGAKTEEKASE
jgi:large subunit ribosomal protein L3